MTQTQIEGIEAPPRPKVTDDMVREAATKLLADNGIHEGVDDVVSAYSTYADGYDIAKRLDDTYGWDVDAYLVDVLDGLDDAVKSIHRKACQAWVLEHNIQPPLPSGTHITRGVICGVSSYVPATYQVKENGCTKEGRFLLVKFEDAEAIP
jgi:hypothetical protein